MGGKLQSVFSLTLFVVKLPLLTLGYIYKSCVYVGFVLPTKSGRFVVNKVSRTYRGVSEWYYGEPVEKDHVSYCYLGFGVLLTCLL